MTKLDAAVAHYSFKAKCAAKKAADKFLKDERGDVNVVSIVVLIAIAVILALAFKDKIVELLTKLFKGIDENTDNINKTTNF